MTEHSFRAIRREGIIRVYQAYRPKIAREAVKHQRFVDPFSFSRMTWIKPSFYWMMHRSGFASKPDQERVLAIDIHESSLMAALEVGVLSSFSPRLHASMESWRASLATSPVRVQWDPERDWRLRPIPGVRAIQIGISGDTVRQYAEQWIVRIEDITDLAHRMAGCVKDPTEPMDSPARLEEAVPLTAAAAARVCAPELGE